MDSFWHAFIPLLVAFDGVGVLPLFWALANHLEARERQRAASEAVLTALLVAVGFLLVSRFILSLMGLHLSDVMMAGGAILITLSLRDLLFSEELPKGSYANPGMVPLGVPLLTGPAVLTTVLLVRDRYGWALTLVALFANMALIWIILRGASRLMRFLGREGSQVISKIANLVLTAFGVMLIRQAIALIVAPGAQAEGP